MTPKAALDRVIRKSRVHFYKPIQIAEILFRNRVADLSLEDVENYRSQSKRWRDAISLRLVRSISTSSSRFQDNLFEPNAMPPSLLKELGRINRENNGLVEAYIYLCMINKFNDLGEIREFLTNTPVANFNLDELLALFSKNPGLRRSMDKVYEIIAFSLFESVIDALDVRVNVSIKTNDRDLIRDFNDFTQKVIGLRDGLSIEGRARVFRVGSTNSSDGGIDLWANFGPAIQVKHFSIRSEHVQSITSSVKADRFVVVCTDADKDIIESVLKQAGTFPKVQSIVTLSDLRKWYETATNDKHQNVIGVNLLSSLLEEFEYEFPSSRELPFFIAERGYDQIELPQGWNPPRDEIASKQTL